MRVAAWPDNWDERYKEFFRSLHGDEQHQLPNKEGDCPNPKCDYKLTSNDWNHIEWYSNWQCSNCGYEVKDAWRVFEVFDEPGGTTRAGMTPQEMGQLGENVLEAWAMEVGGIPGLGLIIWSADSYRDPIDFVIGEYAVEAKTIHSETYPRFKISPMNNSLHSQTKRTRQQVIEEKRTRLLELARDLGRPLKAGMIGVRLNFYTNQADFFFAEDFKDRRVTAMVHLGTWDFSALNPFKEPGDVPPANELPREAVGDEDEFGSVFGKEAASPWTKPNFKLVYNPRLREIHIWPAATTNEVGDFINHTEMAMDLDWVRDAHIEGNIFANDHEIHLFDEYGAMPPEEIVQDIQNKVNAELGGPNATDRYTVRPHGVSELDDHAPSYVQADPLNFLKDD